MALLAESRDASTAGAPARSLVVGVRWLTLATVGVGLLNYLYSLGLTHALDVGDFAVFAAGQALLLTAGSVANTSVPWVLAQALAGASTALERRQAITFAVVTNACLAVGTGLLVTLLALSFAPLGAAATVGTAGALIFLSSTTSGFLQGEEQVVLLGLVRIGDALGKIVVGLLLVVLGWGATGALGGFGVGALLIVVAGAVLIGRELRPALGGLRLRTLWRSAAGVALVQALVSALATVDLVLVAALSFDSADAGSYQASMILSRVPLFLAGAVGVAVFPLLARDPDGAGLVRTAFRLYLALVLPYAVALVTVPPSLVGLVFPAEYEAVTTLLPVTAMAGLLIGAITLMTTAFQAQRHFVRCLTAQVVGIVLHLVALLLGMWWGGVLGLAAGAAVGSAVTVGLLALTGSTLWPRAFRPPLGILAGCTVFAVVLLLVREYPMLWLAVTASVGLATATHLLGRRSGAAGSGRAGPSDGGMRMDGRPRLRILHLGFEDWRKPGSGGGAVRTREVNERLARHHDVTVLVSRYRGAQERVERGVRYVPVGLWLGYWGGILSYFAFLPWAARKRRSDLVVEDFAAPIGSVLPRLWSRRPLVAVVQWLDAQGKSKQYHLPFHRIETAGVRGHDRFVAMSEDLAVQLREGNPTAEVVVVPNGVPTAAFTTAVPRGADLVFLGRLDIAQKGLDLLLPAIAQVRDRLPGKLVLAGDGRDRRAVERLVERAGLADRVVFAGRVDGEEKLRLLAGARLVVMPSRYETFGLVAAEALACGTPVVAFEIPCLREVVAPGTGVLVPAFDVSTYGEVVAELAADLTRVEQLGARGREHARRYDWDDVSEQQEAVYLRAVADHADHAEQLAGSGAGRGRR